MFPASRCPSWKAPARDSAQLRLLPLAVPMCRSLCEALGWAGGTGCPHPGPGARSRGLRCSSRARRAAEGANGPEGPVVGRRKSPGLFVFNGTVRGPSLCRHRRRWLSLLWSVESHAVRQGRHCWIPRCLVCARGSFQTPAAPSVGTWGSLAACWERVTALLHLCEVQFCPQTSPLRSSLTRLRRGRGYPGVRRPQHSVWVGFMITQVS